MKIGPVNGKFESQIELVDVMAPESYRLLVAGKGPAGHVKGEGEIRLAQENGVTVMHYAGDARIGGKIAAVGTAPARCGSQTNYQASAQEAIEAG